MKRMYWIFMIIALIGIAGCAAGPTKRDNVKENAEKSFEKLDSENAKMKN